MEPRGATIPAGGRGPQYAAELRILLYFAAELRTLLGLFKWKSREAGPKWGVGTGGHIFHWGRGPSTSPLEPPLRPPLFYRRRTFVATCENSVTVATEVGWGPVWMIPLHCPTSKTPTLVQESGTYLPYKPSQFYVQIFNFSLLWQQREIRMTPRNCPISKPPDFLQESGTYLLHKPSYSQFCVQVNKFLLKENFKSFTKSCSHLL